MAIAHVNSTSGNTAVGGASTLVLNIPTASTNDVMIMLVGGIGGSGYTIATPSGWTIIPSCTQNVTTNRSAGFYRVVDGSEGSTVTITPSTSANMCGGISAYSGVDTTTPIDISGSEANGGADNNTIRCPSVDPTATTGIVIAMAYKNSHEAVTPATGYTERWEAHCVNNFTPAAESCDTLTYSDPTGTVNITTTGLNAGQRYGHHVVLKVAAATTKGAPFPPSLPRRALLRR